MKVLQIINQRGYSSRERGNSKKEMQNGQGEEVGTNITLNTEERERYGGGEKSVGAMNQMNTREE